MSRLVEQLERTEASALDAAGVAVSLRDLRRLRGFLAETEHAIARRANELAASGSGAPADEAISAGGICSPREAARTARRAETLGSLPSMSKQLGAGRVGNEHADSVAAAAHTMNDAERAKFLSYDDELAQQAASTTPGQFKRYVARLVDQLAADRGLERVARQRESVSLTKGINDVTGMYWLRGELDPESGARLFRAIDAETRALAADSDSAEHSRQQLAAHALVELATSASRQRRPGRVELLALVDVETITNGLHDASICELDDGTVLPVETLRRLACDAHIIPVVLDGASVPLDLGRSRRLASNGQRRALRSMYRTCGIGECDVPFDQCEIHHLTEWTADQGETDLDSLIPGCARHHHLVHEGGWVLDLDPSTRELTITLRDGTVHSRSRPQSVAAVTAGRVA